MNMVTYGLSLLLCTWRRDATAPLDIPPQDMDLTQTFEDIENVVEASRYSETDTRNGYNGDDIEATEEKVQETEAESGVIDKTDVSADYTTELEARRAKDLTVDVEGKRKQLRQLIDARSKKDDDASEETLITPEDEITASDGASSESSVHPCLLEIDISDSQLKLVNPYTMYPAPDDPGLLLAYWVLHERPAIHEDGDVRKFRDAVKRFGARPIRSFADTLITDEVNLRYYGLGSGATRAICVALADNIFVQKVDLKDNKLSADSCKHLNELLLENNVITSLSLSGCQIGANGAKKLCDAVTTNATLKNLDLSNCNIGNVGFERIASALAINNQGLEELNLSSNRLDESCSESLRDLLSCSETLTRLDLSWNALSGSKTWTALADGLERNETLLSLNLSWNALGTECLPHLYQLLTRTRSIEKMDLSWNRFTENDAVTIAKGLSNNNTLQELYLGNNPVRAQGALVLVRAITTQSDGSLRLLDLENVWANKDILRELKVIGKIEPPVVVKLGGVLSNYQLAGPNSRRILLSRANYEATTPKRKRQRRNFGHFVMSLQDKTIPREEFVELIRKFKLKLSKSLIDEIMSAFGGPKNKVDQGLLRSFYLEWYPETTAARSRKERRFKAAKGTKGT